MLARRMSTTDLELRGIIAAVVVRGTVPAAVWFSSTSKLWRW